MTSFVGVAHSLKNYAYISAEAILELEQKYGKPEEIRLSYEMNESEFEIVRGSQKHGRAQEVHLESAGEVFSP